ncbi:hypothetical protein KY285_031048 [Solanum tuberosum]|nr:hypothetical protein KY285_031048 [Solanum tuberosum]
MVGFGGEMEITRRCANHHPSVWGDHFLAYANLLGTNEWEEKEHEDQKGGVRKMLVMAPSKSLQKLELINTIQLLGVAYHFEHYIEQSLSEIFNDYEEWIGEFGESDLHAVALSFRLLRQQGYYVSSDAFRKFINEQGNYKEALTSNVQGLLSLYEAAQFRVHDEEILDEAINFTTTHLKLILPNLSDPLATQVSNALKFPINNIIVRVGTRKYISFYQEDESHNEMLLNFAKLDFNILQRLHKKELCDITRWWKESEIAQALPFARDRVVELYFWSLGVYFVPQYSVARKILTKVLCFCSIMDDTYDTYGTLDELTLLTTAIERWDIDASEQLPPYMKLSYPSCIIARLLNDLVTHEIEVERGDVASGIECYMNEHGATTEEAYIEIRKIIESNWKDLNRGCLKPTTVPRVLLMPVLNLTRVAEVFYKDEDAYTFSKNNLKDVISMVLIDAIKA